MCGFVAVLAPSVRIPPDLLDVMRDRLAHRGPDGAGSWIGRTASGSAIGLAHRRLAILDLSDAAAQPMFSADRRYAIVYNGEIYNFIELREQLEQLGHQFRTRSDTEVLLASYIQWGPECLDRLNGMFGFAVWDEREQRLFVARDRFGEKPVFIAQIKGAGIAVASEMKALFAHPDVEIAVDPDQLKSYVRNKICESDPETLFLGVRRLPPAHALLIESNGEVIRQWRYWTPDYLAIGQDYDPDSAVEEFRMKLERSIEMRLRSDVAVGSSLSGGLDSSTIVGMLAGMRKAGSICTQNTFSARFDHDPTLSEGAQIDAVVARTKVNAFSTSPDPDRLVAECRAVHWHQEEPFASASIYLQYCVARLARENDTIVLLDGQGADELLAGYQHYFKTYQLDLSDRWQLRRLVRETRSFNDRLHRASLDYADSARRFDRDIAFGLRRLLLKRLKPMKLKPRPAREGMPPPRAGMRLRRQISEALLHHSLPALLRYADRNAMAFGRETRFPFLDYDLVDWCISLPDDALIRDGWQKLILRRAADGVLPEEIQWRADKVGYAAPQDVWMRGPMHDWAHDNLFSGPVVDVPGYDRPGLERLWSLHQSGARNTSWALWRWISLNQWLLLMRNGLWRNGLDDEKSTPALDLTCRVE